MSPLGIASGVVGVAAVGLAIFLLTRRGRVEQRVRAERRRRFTLLMSEQEIPLVQQADTSPQASAPPIQPPAPHLPPLPEWAEHENSPPNVARVVQTVDGPMVLTTAPYRRRASILSARQSRFFRALRANLDAERYHICPRIRLDSLLEPRPLQGMSAEDYRVWRKRVRVRSVDFVICDLASGAMPVLAIQISRGPVDATHIGGGHAGDDGITAEALRTASIAAVRCQGDFDIDWPVIAVALGLA